jgi:hypothetical protein
MRLFPARESRWRAWLPEDAPRRRGAVPGGEPVAAGEPVDVAGAGEQPGGARGPDAVQLHQGRSAGGDQFGEFPVQRPGSLAGGLELASQPGGEPAAGLAGQVPRPDGGDQRPGLPGGQELPAPPGSSSSSRRCSRPVT